MENTSVLPFKTTKANSFLLTVRFQMQIYDFFRLKANSVKMSIDHKKPSLDIFIINK